MNEPNDKQLEKYIDSLLRAQPPRRAPASLEINVLAAIARRAALPWWKQSFSAWPLLAKALFLISSVGFVKIGLIIATWGTSPLDTASTTQMPQSFAWLQIVTTSLVAIFNLIPSFWIYATLSVLAAMYVLLFGVSAAAYRTLYAPR